MTPDCELLRRYAETSSEDAFGELVRRHLDLVHSAALRQANGDAHLAQDVAQTVFAELALKAAKLSRREVLTGWLYTTTHFVAAKAVRLEHRRHAHEKEAQTMRELLHDPTPELDWDKLCPVLDNVMHELKEADREAILLRYFENRPFAEVGATLGLSENAARMRVDRAVEKLRTLLSRRGVTTVAAISTVISANAVQLAPTGLAATFTSASLAGAAGSGSTLTLLKIITMTKLKAGIIGALVVAGIATPLVVQQHRAQDKLFDENESLRQQLGQLQTDNERLSNLVAQVNTALSSDQLNDLLRLRGEVGLLRQQTNELAKLREENRQFQAKQNSQAVKLPSEEVTRDYFPKASWKFVGYDTPEAAFQSSAWAGSQGKIKVYLNTLTPELREGMRQELESKSESELAEEIGKQSSDITGYTILNKEVVSDDEVVLTITMGVDNAKIRMKKIDDEWKYAGPVMPIRN